MLACSRATLGALRGFKRRLALTKKVYYCGLWLQTNCLCECVQLAHCFAQSWPHLWPFNPSFLTIHRKYKATFWTFCLNVGICRVRSRRALRFANGRCCSERFQTVAGFLRLFNSALVSANSLFFSFFARGRTQWCARRNHRFAVVF